MATSQEEIRIRFGLNAEAVKSGMEAMLEQQRGIASEFTSLWKRAGAAFVEFLSVGEAINFGKELITSAKEIQEASARLNVSTDEVQRLGYAANMTGQSIGTIAGSFDRLARAKESALGGNAADADAFAKFGISIVDLNAMSPDELFSRIAESIERTGVNSQVTANAMQLMGKSAGELLPAMKELSGLKKAAPLVNEEDVKNLANAANASRSLWDNVKAVSATALSGLLSPIEGFENTQFKNSAEGSNMNRLAYLLEQQKTARAAVNFGGGPSKVIDLTKQAKEDAIKTAAIEKEITEEKSRQAEAGLTPEQKRMEVVKQIKDLEYQIKQAPWEGLSPAETAQLQLDKEKLITQEKNLQLDIDTQATNLSRKIGQNKAELAQREAVYPTIGDLAGRRYTERLDRQYGKGGRYDLGRGNGYLSGVAQDYELASKQQQWDLTYGNAVTDAQGNLTGGAAFDDRQRMISDRDTLIKSGAAKPELQWEKMRENTDAMVKKLEELIGGGAVIKTTITGTD